MRELSIIVWKTTVVNRWKNKPCMNLKEILILLKQANYFYYYYESSPKHGVHNRLVFITLYSWHGWKTRTCPFLFVQFLFETTPESRVFFWRPITERARSLSLSLFLNIHHYIYVYLQALTSGAWLRFGHTHFRWCSVYRKTFVPSPSSPTSSVIDTLHVF